MNSIMEDERLKAFEQTHDAGGFTQRNLSIPSDLMPQNGPMKSTVNLFVQSEGRYWNENNRDSLSQNG